MDSKNNYSHLLLLLLGLFGAVSIFSAYEIIYEESLSIQETPSPGFLQAIPIGLTGKIETVISEKHPHRKGTYFYKLQASTKTNEKKTYTLDTKYHSLSPLISGSKVQVLGLLYPNKTIEIAPPSYHGFVVIDKKTPLPVNGDQSTIALLSYFDPEQNLPEPSFISKNQVSELLSKTNNFFKETSYQKSYLDPENNIQIQGWYHLPIPANCNYDQIKNMTIQAADADIDFNKFQNIIVISLNSTVEKGNNCDYNSQTTLGPTTIETADGTINTSLTWLDGNSIGNAINEATFAHQLGHGFGLTHNGFLNCNNTLPPSLALYSRCKIEEGGDIYSNMGAGYFGHFNPIEKKQLSWISKAETARLNALGEYTFELYPLENSAKNLKVIEIPFGRNQEFIISWRQKIGFDQNIALNTDAFQGPQLHLKLYDNSFLIDPSLPESNESTALTAGSTYETLINAITRVRITAIEKQIDNSDIPYFTVGIKIFPATNKTLK